MSDIKEAAERVRAALYGQPSPTFDPAVSFDLTADAIGKLLAFYDARQWRPIETAPKGGSILVCTATSRAPDKRMTVASWWFDDWASSEPCRGDSLHEPPTHWLPLPAPPVETGEG